MSNALFKSKSLHAAHVLLQSDQKQLIKLFSYTEAIFKRDFVDTYIDSFPDFIHNSVDHLFADGVVATRVVISRVLLAAGGRNEGRK